MPQGWGVGSLDQDADDLLLLSRHLRAEMGSEALVIMGHSTGTQDAVRFCQRHGGAEGAAPLAGVILQAPVSWSWLPCGVGKVHAFGRALLPMRQPIEPSTCAAPMEVPERMPALRQVSDREWLSHFYPDVLALLPKAEAMVAAGQGDEIICRAPDDLGAAPLCARRLAALAARLGDDDMWSGCVGRHRQSRFFLALKGAIPAPCVGSGRRTVPLAVASASHAAPTFVRRAVPLGCRATLPWSAS